MISIAARTSVTVSFSPSNITIKTSVINGVKNVKLVMNVAEIKLYSLFYRSRPPRLKPLRKLPLIYSDKSTV